MARIFRLALAGLIGAFIAWAIMEPTSLMPNYEASISSGQLFLVGMITGLAIGLMIGIAGAISGLSSRDGFKAVLVGAVVGAVGGILGLSFGNAAYNAIKLVAAVAPGFTSFLLLIVARSFGWSLIGGFIGLSQGMAVVSTKKMRNGAIGGFIGGGIGGCVFQIMVFINGGRAIGFPPPLVRLVSFCITGLAIGFVIGLVDELAKRAWLVKLLGRNEGKEYELLKSVTVIGRSELVDVPIFTDPDVAERHAMVILQQNRYVIQDLGSFMGTTVNGVRTPIQPLADGDTITVGKTKLLFHDKERKRSNFVVKTQSLVSLAGSGVSGRACAYCGEALRPDGACSCNVHPDTSNSTQAMDLMPTVSRAALSSPRLAGVAGDYSGTVFDVQAGIIVIGRDGSNPISLLNDSTVSRRHAQVTAEGGHYYIEDLGSANGTYVNAERTTKKELVPGDIVQIGNTKFRFDVS